MGKSDKLGKRGRYPEPVWTSEYGTANVFGVVLLCVNYFFTRASLPYDSVTPHPNISIPEQKHGEVHHLRYTRVIPNFPLMERFN